MTKIYLFNVAVIYDAAQSNDHWQMAYFSPSVIGDVSIDAIFHTLTWSSYKSKVNTQSVGAEETLAAGSATGNRSSWCRHKIYY